jgi:hypothetical protein
MRVRFYHAHNISLVQGGEIIIKLRVAARIDDDHFARPDNRVRGMSQTLIVKLIDDHKLGIKIGISPKVGKSVSQELVMKQISKIAPNFASLWNSVPLCEYLSALCGKITTKDTKSNKDF